MVEITAEQFRQMTGHDPEQDDLERVNCPQVGQPRHSQCGVCPTHEKPRIYCGCLAPAYYTMDYHALELALIPIARKLRRIPADEDDIRRIPLWGEFDRIYERMSELRQKDSAAGIPVPRYYRL